MKTWFHLLLLIAMGFDLARGAETEKVSYYVQLVRGNHGEKPVAGAKPIGAKVSKRLRPVFKWENYWEMNRQKLELPRGRKAKVRLSKDREVEIDLTQPGKRIVIAYQAGKAVSRTTRPIGGGMTIAGGDRDGASVWFVVVRRDEPAN